MAEGGRIHDSLIRSARFGERSFPSAEDYEMYFRSSGYASSAEDVWSLPELAIQAQRHWYRQGQVGCLFASRFARLHGALGWRTQPVMVAPGDLTQEMVTELVTTHLSSATIDPKCELLSLLFPLIRTPEALSRLVERLVAVEAFQLAYAEQVGDTVAISLQASIPGVTVKAWVLGLGPFNFLPPTRRAPSTEIIVRPKAKPAVLFHRVNQDRAIAHLADAPLRMSDSHADRAWSETQRAVRGILGHQPNLLSAAKTTFCLPSVLWR